MYKRILLSVALQRYFDYTPHALCARDLTLCLARNGEELLIISAIADIPLIAEDRPVSEKLDKFCVPFRESGIGFDKKVLKGDPKKIIIEEAKKFRPDLIIIGSHSKRGPLEISLGGTASSIIKKAPCQVVTVSPDREQAKRTKELIIPEYPFIFPYF